MFLASIDIFRELFLIFITFRHSCTVFHYRVKLPQDHLLNPSWQLPNPRFHSCLRSDPLTLWDSGPINIELEVHGAVEYRMGFDLDDADVWIPDCIFSGYHLQIFEELPQSCGYYFVLPCIPVCLRYLCEMYNFGCILQANLKVFIDIAVSGKLLGRVVCELKDDVTPKTA